MKSACADCNSKRFNAVVVSMGIYFNSHVKIKKCLNYSTLTVISILFKWDFLI